jgi:hypothetical protein
MEPRGLNLSYQHSLLLKRQKGQRVKLKKPLDEHKTCEHGYPNQRRQLRKTNLSGHRLKMMVFNPNLWIHRSWLRRWAQSYLLCRDNGDRQVFCSKCSVPKLSRDKLFTVIKAKRLVLASNFS